MKQTCNY